VDILEDALSAISFNSREALCLGLGSPSSSANASAQLAFLIEMSDCLKVDRSKVSVYDPVFTADDLLIFDGLKIRVLTENRACSCFVFKGEYPLDTPTFCFMPHCDMELYESLLRANWAPERLCNLFLVANHLKDYLDSNPTHTLETRVPCLLRLAPLLEFKQLPASKSRQTAFNNTSAQYLSSKAPLLEEWFTEESKSKSPALSETE
ncbi:SRR1-domain-containing protein, partial [Crucibulum laeve]